MSFGKRRLYSFREAFPELVARAQESGFNRGFRQIQYLRRLFGLALLQAKKPDDNARSAAKLSNGLPQHPLPFLFRVQSFGMKSVSRAEHFNSARSVAGVEIV